MGSDDDGGGMSNALIRVELPAGAYTIMANSYAADETGAYELSLAAAGSGSSGSASTVLRAGSTASGSLDTSDPTFDDESYFDEWTYSGQGGEVVTITMTSDDLDSYLIAYRGIQQVGPQFGSSDQ